VNSGISFHTDICVGNNKSSQREDEYEEKLTISSFNYRRRRQFPIPAFAVTIMDKP
jgi:hypothetical protein